MGFHLGFRLTSMQTAYKAALISRNPMPQTTSQSTAIKKLSGGRKTAQEFMAEQIRQKEENDERTDT